MPDAAMILAAGFGTRMGALTRDQPKPLIAVAGRTLLDHALDQAAQVPRRVVNVHYMAARIVDHLANTDVMTSIEAPDILESGGGIKAALPLLRADLIYTLNADAIWRGPNALECLHRGWAPEHMDALLLCVPLPRAVGRQGGGDFSLMSDGRLSRGGDLVYTGAQILKTDRIAREPRDIFGLNDIWNRIAEDGRLFGAVYPGHWCDVGHPGGIVLAEDLLARSDV